MSSFKFVVTGVAICIHDRLSLTRAVSQRGDSDGSTGLRTGSSGGEGSLFCVFLAGAESLCLGRRENGGGLLRRSCRRPGWHRRALGSQTGHQGAVLRRDSALGEERRRLGPRPFLEGLSVLASWLVAEVVAKASVCCENSPTFLVGCPSLSVGCMPSYRAYLLGPILSSLPAPHTPVALACSIHALIQASRSRISSTPRQHCS